MVNWANVPPNKSFALHYHEDMDEVFIIVNGSCEITIGGETQTLTSGDAALVKAMTSHTMNNTTDSVVEYIVFGVSTEKGGKTINI